MSERAYDIVNLRTGGGGTHQPHVRVRCSNCVGPASILEFACVTSTPPEHVAKKIRSKGWEFVLENRRYTCCPECIRLRDFKRKGESPGPKQVEVELFGKNVQLPTNVVPPELVPPPPPTHEPRVFRKEPPPPPPARFHTMQRYRIELATAHDLADLVVALKAIGNTTMVTLITEESPVVQPKDVPFAQPTENPNAKSPETIKKMRQSQVQRAKAYAERVRNALLEVRKEKSNGRAPSLHEYVRGLTAKGVEPFRPGRPWTASIVQRHLDAMDSR